MDDLTNSINTIYKTCFELKEDESVLILIDPHYKELSKSFETIAKNYTKSEIKILEIPEGKINGEEPPESAAKEMLNYKVIIILTKKSLTHTKARKKASKNNSRIASMPSVTEEMLKRCIGVDYTEMNSINNKLCDLMDKASTMRLVKYDGTDLTFSIKGRVGHGRHCGIFINQTEYGNLPDGEAFIAPLEGTANGTYIIDGSVAREGLVDKPIKVTVKDGYATNLEGGEVAKTLLETLKEKGKEAFNIAEFGIGSNPKAIITGNMLEDEKVKGTIHIAFGNNTGFDGHTEVQLHIDCLVKEPTFFIDDKKVMEKGNLLLD